MKPQQGSTLIITVVILFAVTMIGLYAMRGTIIQDKMTANINNKTATVNTAEDGATQFLNWFSDRFKTGGAGWPTGTDQETAWRGNIASGLIPYTNPVGNDVSINIQHGRYYWVDTTKALTTATGASCSNPCWDDTNKQVTVQITGNIVKGTGSDSKIIGTSVYQAKFAAPKQIKLPDLPAALTLAGRVQSGKYEANSNNFSINGDNKLAIATMDIASKDVIVKHIQDTSSGNGNGNGNGNGGKGSPSKNKELDYIGGVDCPATGACVKDTNLGLWGDANQVINLVKSIVPSYPQVPSTPIPNVTYVNGDTGKITNCTGIIIINGDVTDGKSTCGDINGVLIILGGLYHIDGGGNLNINGAVYVANIQLNPTGGYQFGNTEFSVNGGGGFAINYSNQWMSGGSGLGYTAKTSIIAWNDIL